MITKRYTHSENSETLCLDRMEDVLKNTLKTFIKVKGVSISIPLLCYDEFNGLDLYATDCAKLYATVIKEFIKENTLMMEGHIINICRQTYLFICRK